MVSQDLFSIVSQLSFFASEYVNSLTKSDKIEVDKKAYKLIKDYLDLNEKNSEKQGIMSLYYISQKLLRENHKLNNLPSLFNNHENTLYPSKVKIKS